jgi:ribosomal protein S18 acetylase RimI-like enzyme
MKTLSNKSGSVHIKASQFADKLFEIDTITSKAALNILPLESKDDLLNFLEIEHNSKTFIWNDKEGKIVGYLSYIENPDEKQRVELLNLIVLPKYWRKGFGKKMVGYYHKLMRDKGFKKSKLVTSPNNIDAIKFYEKAGYSKIKTIKNYYGPGEDRILMIYNL